MSRPATAPRIYEDHPHDILRVYCRRHNRARPRPEKRALGVAGSPSPPPRPPPPNLRSISVTIRSIRNTKADSTNMPANTPATSNTPSACGSDSRAGGRAEIFADHRADHGEATEVCSDEKSTTAPRASRHAASTAARSCRASGRWRHRAADFLDALIDVEEHDEEHQRDAERHLRPMPSPSHSVKIGARTTRAARSPSDVRSNTAATLG